MFNINHINTVCIIREFSLDFLTGITVVLLYFTITRDVTVSVFGLAHKEQPNDTSLHAAQNFYITEVLKEYPASRCLITGKPHLLLP
jgi:hypothetical protein